MSYRVINGKLYPVESYTNYAAEEKKKAQPSKNSFKDFLTTEVDKNESFVISNHAAERLRERNISLNESDMKKINEGINMAQQKGSQESVILFKDLVLVASVKNRTIITAVDKDSSKGQVFTNVDSIVLL
jgi:flagellar operon protein